MAISDMTLEQLREYALELENEKATNDKLLAEKDSKIAEITGYNMDLQKHNKKLLLKIEQQGTGEVVELNPNTPQPKPNEDKVLSDEEFVKEKLLKEIKL